MQYLRLGVYLVFKLIFASCMNRLEECVFILKAKYNILDMHRDENIILIHSIGWMLPFVTAINYQVCEDQPVFDG